jgi:predicted small metal-binding protein
VKAQDDPVSRFEFTSGHPKEKKMANQYACANAGASTCGFRTTWTDEADLRRQIANHLVTVHEVKTPTATIVNYLVKVAKDMSGQVQH